MSYILDALNKSEKERGRRKPSRGSAGPVLETQKPPRANRWRYLVAAALLLNAGLLMWWLRPWQTGVASDRTPEQVRDAQTQQAAKAAAPAQTPSGIAPGPASIPQPTASVPVQAPAPVASVTQTASAPTPGVAPTASAKPAASGPVARARVDHAPGAPPTAAPSGPARPESKGNIQTAKAPAPGGGGLNTAPVTRPAATPSAKADGPGRTALDDLAKTKQAITKAKAADVAKKPEGARQQGLGGSRELISDLKALTGSETRSANAVAASRKAARYHELPSQVRDSMPRIAVSMLLYSKKSGERWINVNGSKMREGQEVSAGLKLEEITPDGAVFTYKGHRFYKAVIGD